MQGRKSQQKYYFFVFLSVISSLIIGRKKSECIRDCWLLVWKSSQSRWSPPICYWRTAEVVAEVKMGKKKREVSQIGEKVKNGLA